MSAPHGPLWGPGNPSLSTLYYDTPDDFLSYLNPHYINNGGLVPRQSYVVETDATLYAGCVATGYEGCPNTWRFSFNTPQGGELYWVQMYAWTPAPGNLGRWVWITDADGQSQVFVGVTNWWLETWEYVNCQLPNGGYTSRVSFWNGPQLIYSIPFAFNIGGNQCTAPPVPTPTGPAGCVNTVTPTLAWNAATGADTYDVLLRKLETGQEIPYTNIHGTSFTVPGSANLQANKRHSWAVRAVNANGSSSYSSPLIFTPLCQVPPVPQPLGPSGCITTTTPVLQWTASSGATSYRVRLVKDTGQQITQELTATSWSVPAGLLEENHRYDWTVQAVSEFGASGPSSMLSFTPNCGAPTAPVAQSPTGCVPNLTPTLTWSVSNGATSYEFYIKDVDANHDVVHLSSHTATSYQVPNGILAQDRVYRWAVRGYNQGNNEFSPWSNTLEFTPQCGPPRDAPETFTPKECVDSLQPIFSWSVVPRATSYQLRVTDTTTNTVVINQSPTSTTFAAPAGLLHENTQYLWTVKAVNGQYQGPISDDVYFTPLCKEIDDEEEDRPDEDSCQSGGPPESVGHPVSVLTGNTYLDQVDLTVSGVGTITFGRSYNSSNVKPDWTGIFGPGWSHPYETNIWVRYRLLLLRQPNGAVLYYQDDDGDGVYLPRTARADSSTIRKQGDGTYLLQFRQGGSEVFDSQGRLIRIVDVVGNQTQLIRDGSGKLQSIQDAGGRAVTFGYTNGRLTRIDAPGGLGTVTYGYTSVGVLDTVNYGDGSGYHFDYDEGGRLKTVRDFTGRVVESHTYYADTGRAKTSSLADGRESYEFTYTGTGTAVKNGLNEVTTYDYVEVAGNKHVWRITGPCAGCGGSADLQQWTYDAKGRVTSHSQGQQVVATYEYDPATSDLLVERDGLSHATFYTYYPDGRVRTITGPEGSQKALTYVAAGPSSVSDLIDPGRVRVATVAYNAIGKVDQAVDARDKVTRFIYDGLGDLREIQAPENQIWRFTYDAMGRRATATSPLNATVTTTYDEHGRLKRVTNPDGTFVQYTYDRGGRPTEVRDSLGRATHHGYDAYGRLEFSLDAMGGVTRRSYDLMSRLTAITDALGQATAFEYDGLGRPSRTVYPDGAVETLTYDPQGRISRRTDRRGVATTYTYDAAGRLLRKSYSDATPPVTYAYDSAGRIIRASSGGSGAETLDWSHDLLGRTLSERSAANALTVGYGYDDASNRTSLTLDETLYLTYEYDDASRLRRLRRGSDEFRFEYEASRRARLEFPNGVATVYRYDLFGMSRLMEINAAKVGSPVLAALYEYDAAGNRRNGVIGGYRDDYTYDRLDRLVEVLTAPDGSARFGYDAVGNRIREESGSLVLTAAFGAGNRLTGRTGGGAVTVAGTVSEDAHVTVNGRNAHALEGRQFESQITASPGTNTFEVRAVDLASNVTTSSYDLQLGNSGDGFGSFGYDANGNMIQRLDSVHVLTYEWDAENRLRRALRDGTEVARFDYDPLGRRLRKVAGGVTTRYAYDGDDIVQESSFALGGGATSVRYVHGPGVDEPLARESLFGGSREYFHADGLGSITKITDASGTITLSRRYDAWGNPLAGGATPGYAFTGREWDPETGLYYYRARYYDPVVGRFISEDPIGFAGGVSFYVYGGNRPTVAVDPLGLDWVYVQSTGNLYHPYSPSDSPSAAMDWTPVATGYAGYGNGVNNSFTEATPNVGPLPAGGYAIGPPFNHPHTGRYSMRLTPDRGNSMYGRSGFLIHGDNRRRNRSASNGCVVLPGNHREQIWNSEDHRLQVIHSETPDQAIQYPSALDMIRGLLGW